MRPDLHARFLVIRERALARYAARLEALRRSGPVPFSEHELRRQGTRRRKVASAIVVGWSFMLLSWFQGPWGSGGWYVTRLGGFATKQDCEAAAAWVQKTAAPKPVIPSTCVEDGR